MRWYQYSRVDQLIGGDLMLRILRTIQVSAVLGLLAAAGCADLGAGGYYPSSPGYGGGYSPGHYRDDNYYSRREYERERDRLEHERWELEQERRAAERERHYAPPPPPPPAYRNPPREEQCPAGFHLSTKRCTNEERRRGCKDIGLSNGRGCRNFPG